MIDPQIVLAACGVYILALLTLGFLGRRAMPRRSLGEHFLAGRSIGFLVLLLTLFATQYSGNSLSGFPGKTYRAGLSYIMSVTFMTGIVFGYLFFVPELYRRARQHRYLTPTDFLHHRFGSPTLSYLSALIFAVSLCNFLLAQLMAMGHAFAGLTEGAIPYWGGVVGGAAVIFIYEWLGGLRAVAWTDAIQGFLLAGGLLLVLILLGVHVGTPPEILASISDVIPAKVDNPDLVTCITWISTFLLLGLGAPLYPQAIQRIYAARRAVELRRALTVMALLPLFAITTVIYIGAAGIALFPDLDRVGSDQVTFRVLAHLIEVEPLAAAPVLLVMMAVVAAIMSTADSALLSLSSIFTKDVVARWRGIDEDQSETLLRYASLFSFAILLALGWIALQPRLTLWRLLEIKFEILIQLSPAFLLGTLPVKDPHNALDARDILTGLWIGLGVALGLYALQMRSIHGLHAGTLAVILNYAAVWTSRAWRGRTGSGPVSAEQAS